MPIDAKMLNDAKIFWFGDVLVFTEQQDGSVTVEAKPSEVKAEIPMSQLAKVKVTVTSEEETLKTDFKLTEEEMAEVAKLDKDERYYHRTEEQLIQFAGWKPEFEKE